MIIQPFTVRDRGKQYRFVERSALDSELLKLHVTNLVVQNHAFAQFEAQCAQIGLAEIGPLPNMRFAVFEGSDIVGIWGMGKIDYVSGPWADTVDWIVTNPGDPAILTARPMPGFLDMTPGDEISLSLGTAVSFLGRGAPFQSMEGTPVEFKSLHYAVLPSHTDPISLRARGLHNAAKGDNRLTVTETVDPTNPLRFFAKLELK